MPFLVTFEEINFGNVAVEMSFSDARKAKKKKKKKNASVLNVICKLMFRKFKIREKLPSRLDNHINKLVFSHLLVYLIRNSLGKYFSYLKLTMD